MFAASIKVPLQVSNKIDGKIHSTEARLPYATVKKGTEALN